ncbi:unnamed protein product, partial [Rotaria sordida]
MILVLTYLLIFGPVVALAQTPCNANGRSGVCITTSSCTGTPFSGHCAGAANIQCCVPSDGSSGSSAGLCGSYAGAAVSAIAGNGNVIYSVVKIRPEHLSNPAVYTSAATASDDTVTTSTAWAFNK